MILRSHAIGTLCLLTALSACGGAQIDLNESDKANLDCLAAKTVMEIAAAVRTGLENGATADSLSGIQADFTDTGAVRLAQYYSDSGFEAYFRAETERRLVAMQNALANKAPGSADQSTLDETMAMARTCSFGAI